MAIYQHIYCDESCHLPNDQSNVMVLGGLMCPNNKTREVSLRLKDIKKKNRIAENSEIKWAKLSPSNADFFQDIVDYYFDDDDLSFRAIIASEKNKLDHERFNQDHELWYYKMYFQLLRNMLDPDQQYRIFLDIKDTKGQEKVQKLHQALCNSHYDFNRKIINQVQIVRSHDTPCLQLADILIGAVSSYTRQSITNIGKQKIIERIKERSHLSLDKNTLLKEKKINLFFWRPRTSEEL